MPVVTRIVPSDRMSGVFRVTYGSAIGKEKRHFSAPFGVSASTKAPFGKKIVPSTARAGVRSPPKAILDVEYVQSNSPEAPWERGSTRRANRMLAQKIKNAPRRAKTEMEPITTIPSGNYCPELNMD